MSYPKDLLSSRAVVKPGLWAVIPQEGLVNNVIPNIVGGKVSILCSPKLGASFTQYVIRGGEGCGTTEPFGTESHVECFIYVVEGEAELSVGDRKETYGPGGYAFAPAGEGISFHVVGGEAKLLLYKQVFVPYKDLKPHVVMGNINDVPFRIFDDMENVYIKDFLPTDDLAYDMNMHILSFEPGGCHPFVETHVQEHGAYILSGEGMYLMDETWLGIKKDDFMWFGPFCPQCSYGVGREPFAYVYSKDCNRDVVM